MKLTTLINLVHKNQVFFGLYLLLLLLGSYPLLAWDKINFLLLINSYSHPFFDYFFYYITHLGSGITYILMLLILVLLQVANRKIFIGGTSFVVLSVIVQGLKRIIFADQLRPLQLVPDPSALHLVDHVKVLSELSFPSGHAATIFAGVCLLHLLLPTKNRLYSIFLLGIALAVAYSRMYLCQHFYKDVYVGTCIGGVVTPLVYASLINWQVPDWLTQRLPIKI